MRTIRVGTAGILATAIFLLGWGVVERITGTEPRNATPGPTHHAMNSSGAIVAPGDRLPSLRR